MKTHLIQMKADLKVLAAQIRKLKALRKDRQFNNGCGLVDGLASAQQLFRIKHIAYCLLRGRSLQQIENHHRSDQDANRQWVYKKAAEIVAKVTEEVNGSPIRPTT